MGSLFSTKSTDHSKTPVAPTPDDDEEQASKEREYQRQYGKRGRSGTVLSDGDSKLG